MSGSASLTSCAASGQIGIEGDRVVIVRAYGNVHRYSKLICVRGFGVSGLEGVRSDHQSRLHCDQGASEFKDKSTGIYQLWQSDFAYLKIIGWSWFYLSTPRSDYSRYIISWNLCTNMRTQDVTDRLDLTLLASGCDQVNVIHKPRVPSDNGSSYASGKLAEGFYD